jgi:L-ribulokinase
MIPNYYGYEAGQTCVGDHFDWFVNNFISESYKQEADINNISAINLLTNKAAKLKPGESGIIALDWWNGNRSILVDADLSGLFIGMNLNTKPEELYRALIEATALGTKIIVDHFNEYGIKTTALYAAGGIAAKDPFTMQIYSDVLNMDIYVSDAANSGALGSAIFGSLAAGKSIGGYDDIKDAVKHMSKLKDTVFKPNKNNNAVYNALYIEYKKLHDYFGTGGNDIMKRLKAIKSEVNL